MQNDEACATYHVPPRSTEESELVPTVLRVVTGAEGAQPLTGHQGGKAPEPGGDAS